jgi:hypothetical protein
MEPGKAVSCEAGTLVGDGGESPAFLPGEDVNQGSDMLPSDLAVFLLMVD